MKRKNRGRFGNFIGSYYSDRNQKTVEYYSIAERTVMRMLERNYEVQSYTTQDLEIPVEVGANSWMYTPDIVVKYKNGTVEVIEVKKTTADANKKQVLIRKEAGERFCAQKGWRFSIMCEEDIDQIQRRNIDFLFGFRNRLDGYDKWAAEIVSFLSVREKRIKDVLDRFDNPKILPLLYYMVFRGEIETDLFQPLSHESILKAGIPNEFLF